MWDNQFMKFSQLASYFKRLEDVSARLEITAILSQMWEELTPEEAKNVAYLLRGRVCPHFVDMELGMAEKTVLKAIAEAMNVEKSIAEKYFNQNGDLGETAQILKEKAPINMFSSDLEINEVFEKLLEIAKMSGTGSNLSKIANLIELFQTLDGSAGRFIARIPTGELRLGCSDMTIIDSLSWFVAGDKSLSKDIEGAFQVRPDLGEIAKLIREGKIAEVKEIIPTLFVPVRMMRAQRADSGEDMLTHAGEVLVEPKYDGMRLQIHLDKNEIVKIYTRGLEDATHMYPDVVNAVKIGLKGHSGIIEGEAVGYDPATDILVPFQQTATRKRKYDIDQAIATVPLRLHVFDILLLDGRVTFSLPLFERRQILEKILKTDPKSFILSPQTKTQDPNLIDKLFDEAISQGLEGVMVKKIDGPYQAGARGWNWMKLKMSYSEKMTDTLDCLVMGFDRGKGKRSGFGAGAFLVGIRDEKLDKYVTVAKIGTGLTDEEWRRIAALEKELSISNCPDEYEVDKMMVCDVWLRPNAVVEIRADEITRSQMHTAGRVVKYRENGVMDVSQAGFALRFPRLEKWREDKDALEVTKLSELQQIAKVKI